MKRTTCSACGAGDLEMFLDLGPSPIADAYTEDLGLDAPRYPLQVATCPKCHLVQLLEVVDADVLFGTGYSFYSSASPPLSAYHARYAADLLRDFADQAAMGVLEIGCNDGDMLRHFAHLPHLGVDPADGPIEVARDRGLSVLQAAFSSTVARTENQFGLVIANHVLAHVADVSDVLAGIAHVLRPDGIAFIEVQYLPDLLINNSFDLIYHEHRNFFSLSTLEYALWRHDLALVRAELTDRQGGSLRAAIVPRSTMPATLHPSVYRLRESERWLASFGAYEGMQGRAERIRDRLVDMIADRQADQVVALYGAPAKATTLLNFCGLTYVDLPYCWDTTPAKQGRHIPGTGIEIRPDWHPDRPDVFLLAAWNYLRPIMRGHPGFEWIVPFPAPLALS